MPSQGGAKPKLLWGSAGQHDLYQSLFAPGGSMWALGHGAPDPAYESGVNRGMTQLNQNLAQQGIFGSPLGGLAATQYASQAATGREQNRLGLLLNGSRPISSGSVTGGGGIMSMSGL